jgi:hypothetical protein
MNYLLKTGGWSVEVEDLLAPAMSHDPLASLDGLRVDVETGQAMLFTLNQGLDLTGAFVLRVDRADLGRECVLVAGGARPGHRHTVGVLEFSEAMAAQLNCDFIRLHTARDGLARMLPDLGWHEAERVYRKGICHGRA